MNVQRLIRDELAVPGSMPNLHHTPSVKQNRFRIFRGVKRSVTFNIGQNSKPIVVPREQNSPVKPAVVPRKGEIINSDVEILCSSCPVWLKFIFIRIFYIKFFHA